MLTIEQLNSEFAIKDQLHFISGEGNLPFIVVENDKAAALISTYAGQVLSFQPADDGELLFLSKKAYYQQGKAIKGGIPICWPWFGADPEGSGPAHGLVRNRQWDVLSTTALEDGSTQICLGISDNKETRNLWPHSFQLTIEITIGSSLTIELITHNSGTEPVTISQALHTYFEVGDISQVQVLGLENHDYLDKADNGLTRQQSGPVIIENEVDRIYTETQNDLFIDDTSLARKIHITASGSKTAVVWNPWAEIAASMSDLNNDDYQQFLCVETVNAVNDTVNIQPGNQYHLLVNYSIEK